MRFDLEITPIAARHIRMLSLVWQTTKLNQIVSRAVWLARVVESARRSGESIGFVATLLPVASGDATRAELDGLAGRRTTVRTDGGTREDVLALMWLAGLSSYTDAINHALSLVSQLEQARRELSDAEYLGWLGEMLS